jgi:AcrR family transcriptional regulator
MQAGRSYRAQRRTPRSGRTRERILAAVRELLADGSFHESSVEQVAERAGVSRATLYQHFRSRLDLVDAICETFARNPALLELRDVMELPDAAAAVARTIELSVRFWASEDAVLGPLYGVQAIDPAARDLVERQRADRGAELGRLARNLHAMGSLRDGVGERRAHELLLVLTSYETFRELRLAGLAEPELTVALRGSAQVLLLGGEAR